MDGVLGRVDTSYLPDTPSKSKTISEESMAKDLRPGQTIRFEFGARDNWVTLHIEKIEPFDGQIILFGQNRGRQKDYSFRPEEIVEVLDA